MATLVSPGISISVVDQTVNVGAGPGTVPLIFIVTQQNKADPTGQNAVAPGTTEANAGLVWSITSQRDLLATFGDPTFYSVSGTSINGYPLNEYGLLSAYSYLGLSNLVRVVRANIDTAQLEPTPVAPTSPAAIGTYWFNESALPVGSAYGLFVRSDETLSASWTAVTPNFVYNNVSAPTVSDGVVGNTAVVFQSTTAILSYWFKTTAGWNQIGTTATPVAPNLGAIMANSSSGTTVSVSSVAGLAVGMTPVVNPLSTGQFFDANTVITSIGPGNQFTVNIAPTGTAINGGLNSAYITASFGVTMQSVWPDLTNAASTEYFWIKTSSPAQGANLVLDIMDATAASFIQVEAPILGNDTAANTYYATDATGATGKIYIEPIASGSALFPNSFEFRMSTGFAGPWAPLLGIVGSKTAPTQGPANGQMWFNSLLGLNSDGTSTIDILINDGMDHWENCNLPGFTLPGATGNPTLYPQSQDPRSNVPAPVLANGDIWVQTDVTPYPVIYRYNGSGWTLVSNIDQTTPSGIIFDDARPNPLYKLGGTVGTGQNNGGGNYPDLDPDAPQAALYPKGFLLWNTRYSTDNVKVWESPYVYDGVTASPDNTNGGSTGRWVNKSGNNAEGAPFMGAAAQQNVLVEAVNAEIKTNDSILAENLYFNLLAAPGFLESVDNLLALNDARGDTAFVVGDTPMTLAPSGTALQNWATNTAGALTDGPGGLITANKFLGLWYPSALTTNTDGTEVVCPPSFMALNTIAYNDQVAYPWFAPAGLQRGVVNNASNVGYVNSAGQFLPVSLGQGQRDILYTNGINPVRVMPQGGIVIFGQKDRDPVSQVSNRINVVRLENYLRYQFNQLAQPYLFEPNDQTTRNAVLASFNAFMSQLVTLRAVYDFLVVCDSSNNTPARIQSNQLWIDVAIQPEIAIEFIYIPIRIVNTGSSLTA